MVDGVLWVGVVPDPFLLFYYYNYFMAGGVAIVVQQSDPAPVFACCPLRIPDRRPKTAGL
jgi:hypothetical protein